MTPLQSVAPLLCWFLGVIAGILLTTRWYPVAYLIAMVATAIVVHA